LRKFHVIGFSLIVEAIAFVAVFPGRMGMGPMPIRGA